MRAVPRRSAVWNEANNDEDAREIHDRRIRHRFPLRLEVASRRIESGLVSNWAIGESLNISSAGLLFTTTETFLPGQSVEVSIAWPALLDNRIALKLVIKGVISRYAGNCAALRLERSEFRTRMRTA